MPCNKRNLEPRYAPLCDECTCTRHIYKCTYYFRLTNYNHYLSKRRLPLTSFQSSAIHLPFPKKSVDTSVPHRQATISPRKTSQVPRKVAVPNTPSKTTFSVGFHGLTKDSATLDRLFTIEHQNQLCLWLEDKLIQMKVLLSSPHLGNLKSKREHLLKTLTEPQEIVMMLSLCQDKVSVSV